MRSCLYECQVMHRRILPKTHAFAYRIFMFALDLDELDEVSRRVRGFGRERWAPYAFCDCDHLSPAPRATKAKLREYLTAQGIDLPAEGRVSLVTLPRGFGYIFNPVSFYYCFKLDGTPLCAVAEVGNTFREMKLFPIKDLGEAGFHRRVAKDFYVSPFSCLDTAFDFRPAFPKDRLEIFIDDYNGGERTLASRLSGKRVELTTWTLARFTLKYPCITAWVILLIHWHALLLWLKRFPFIRKTGNIAGQRDVLRPHRTLAGP